MKRGVIRFVFAIVLSCLALPHSLVVASRAQALRLDAVQVTGLHRYSQQDVLTVGHIEMGQPISVADLDAIARRLGQTGLFSSVQYAYSTAGTSMHATLTIEEAPLTIPVIFDNFVWMSDADLLAAVRQQVPAFDGFGGDSTEFTTFMASALQRVLDARHIDGRVRFVPGVDLATHRQRQTFVVDSTSPLITTCAATFTGSRAAIADEIVASGEPLVGRAYSRSLIEGLESGSWLRFYHNRGYLKASFASPIATIRPECTGVSVTIAVQEGEAYTWDHAAWSGLAALDQATVESTLAMKRGQVADESRIEAGLSDVRRAYLKRGYLTAHATAQPVRFDETSHTVVFNIAIDEGQQYHMGTLTISGVTDKQAADLAKRWKIRAGEIFDATYIDEFFRTEVRPQQTKGALPTVGKHVEELSDTAVNVTLTFQ
jgi:outer membrane protein insertion porin family